MRTYGTLEFQKGIGDGWWAIRGEPHLLLRLKRIFGRVNAKAHGVITLSHSPEVCRDLEWFADRYPLTIDDASRDILTQGARVHRDAILRLEQILDPTYVPETAPLALPARSYQAREAALLLSTGGLLIADDVGLGKTAAAIAAVADPRARPAVVVTLTHLPGQWEDEFAKFAPDLRIFRPKTGKVRPLPTFLGRSPDVVILNYHKLASWAEVLAAFARTIVFDEVQELRHSGSAKYTAAEHVAGRASFRLGLSATPIYNYGGEMFNVLNLLRPGCLGNWQEFYQEWCTGHDKKVRLKDPKAFGAWARESGVMVRHTRAEVGRELPSVIKVPHRIPCDRAALDSVADSAAELARIILTQADTARGEKWQAAEQLSVLLRQATGIAKAPYVADFVRLLAESEERIVLCGWHREVYDIWLSKLADLKPILYTGSETTAQKEKAKAAFLSGDARILVLSLRSGAGLDGLQAVCSAIVFGELDWSPGVHEQCIGRLHRDGQANPVVAYFLAAEDGADPAIAETLGLKREQVEGLRNPHAELLEQLETTGDHTRRLAELYLRQVGHVLPPFELFAPEAMRV